jgi:hypothetical protein
VQLRILVVLLRLGGTLTGLAFLAMVMPSAWMVDIHRSLGLGELPQIPVVDYLTRSVAAIYGFHGGLLFVLSTDPIRFLRVVKYIGWMNIAFGLALLLIDLHAGMPLWWTLGEGPPVVGLGVTVLYLCRSL